VVVKLDLQVATRGPTETPGSSADHDPGSMMRMDNRVADIECPRRFGYL
jgi:hypothetical protein